MSKNIEININTTGSAYEPLYPKTLAENIVGGTLNGSFTFTNLPSCNLNPTAGQHLVRKSWIDSQGYATQSWVNGLLSGVGGFKVARGTRRGTGTTGAYTISTGIKPYIFYLGCEDNLSQWFAELEGEVKPAVNGNTESLLIVFTVDTGYIYVTNIYAKKASDSFRMSVTSTSSGINMGGHSSNAEYGFNKSGNTYNWLAIGK